MCANWWKTNLADNKSVNPLPDLTLRTQKSTIIDFYNRHISHLSHLPPLVTSCGQLPPLGGGGFIFCDDVSAIASLLLRLLFKAKFKSIINNLCRGWRGELESTYRADNLSAISRNWVRQCGDIAIVVAIAIAFFFVVVAQSS